MDLRLASADVEEALKTFSNIRCTGQKLGLGAAAGMAQQVQELAVAGRWAWAKSGQSTAAGFLQFRGTPRTCLGKDFAMRYDTGREIVQLIDPVEG